MRAISSDKSASADERAVRPSHLVWVLLILCAVGALAKFATPVIACLDPFKNFICSAAFVISAALPFCLIIRWRFWGLIASVLGGWALIHCSEASFTWESYFAQIYIEHWAIWGWLYMLVWCSPIYLIVLLWRWVHRVRRRSG